MQFARVAHATDFVYCYSILEANKRSEYANTAASATSPQSSAGSKNPSRFFDLSVMNADLNTFFPFDPYRLPNSSPYIDGIYRDWASVAIADDEDEDDDDDDTVPEKQGIDLRSRDRSEDDLTGGLGASFEGMSISPAR
jgi:RNA polymerase I-specific transcription initiation factor RRN3